jgi:tetratricopeptide (TPR) repeat protein
MSVLDDTEIPGLLPTVSYLGWPPETAETVADIIMAKLNRAKRTSLDWENEARSLYQAYHPEEALAVYEQFFQIYSEQLDSHNWHYKGDILWALKRFEEALEAYEQAIHLNPYSTIPYDGKSFALWKLNRHEETLAVFEQIEQIVQIDTIYPIAYSDYFIGYSPRPDRRSYHCNWSNCSHWTPTAFWQNIQLDPLNVSTYIVKGISYYRQARNGIRLQNGYSIEDKLENCEQALASYVSAIQLNPEYALAYNCKGEMFYTLGGYWEELFPSDCEEVAYAAFEKAIQLNPNYTYAYNNKGKVLYALKRYEEALAAFDQAIQLKSSDPLAYNNKGRALYALKRYEEALAAFEQALQLYHNYANAHNGKGEVLCALKRYEEALAAFDQAIRLNETHAFAYNNRGIILLGLNRYEEALAAFDQAYKYGPQGNSYKRAGHARRLDDRRVPMNRFLYERTIQISPNYATINDNRGKALLALGRYEEALAAFEQALYMQSYDNRSADSLHSKGLVLYALKRYEEALAAYDWGIRVDANCASIYTDKGNTLFMLKHYEEALAVFEQALFIEPSDAYAYNGKALMLFNLKRYDEALAVYEQVIQMDPTFTPAYRGKEHVLKHIGREEEAQRFRKKTRPLGAIQPN